MLTGESIPISKVPLTNKDEKFDIIEDSRRHVIFEGT
jgi:magnesium-transporting ATPase (P-type)